MVIGVIGAPQLAEELREVVRGRRLNDRPILVRSITEHKDIADLHILFVGLQTVAEVKRAVEQAKSTHIVAVTDLEDGQQAGGVINFVLVDGKVRFEIDVGAADQVRARVSARLLRVAHRVHGTTQKQ